MHNDTILVVEDEDQIARVLKGAFEDSGYEVFRAATLAEGRTMAATRAPALIILDLGLPDGDGCELIRTVRSYSSAPVVVLSARSDEASKITALDLGADDYMCKPFGLEELRARVRAHLRRRTGSGPGETASDSARFTFGDVTVDLGGGLVTKAGAEVHLTKLEFRLLAALIAGHGKVLTQRQLLQTVWGAAYVEHPHYLRLYMARLRQKLEENPADPVYFITETGVGYRLKA